jgi:hypothetical protein
VEHSVIKSQALQVRIKEVRPGSKGLEVTYDLDKKDLPFPRRSSSRESLPLFLLAGFGFCGLVIIAPRLRRKRR